MGLVGINLCGRAGACPRRRVRCELTAGAKFSEFGHPFVCFADISPNRGIAPPYPVKCISCVDRKKDVICRGRRGRRPLQTGRRVVAPYPLPLRGSTPSPCEGDVAKRQRETAAVSGWHAVRRDGGRETEQSLPQSNAAHLTAPSRRGHKRREQAPALPCKMHFVRRERS